VWIVYNRDFFQISKVKSDVGRVRDVGSPKTVRLRAFGAWVERNMDEVVKDARG
jgi:hypothetical protein